MLSSDDWPMSSPSLTQFSPRNPENYPSIWGTWTKPNRAWCRHFPRFSRDFGTKVSFFSAFTCVCNRSR